jgi:hypothetical protein
MDWIGVEYQGLFLGRTRYTPRMVRLTGSLCCAAFTVLCYPRSPRGFSIWISLHWLKPGSRSSSNWSAFLYLYGKVTVLPNRPTLGEMSEN